MINRASWVYAFMTVVFVAGIWLVLRLGRSLTPPPNVAGDWTLTWEGGQGSMYLPQHMNVSQSGRYLSVTLGGKGASKTTATTVPAAEHALTGRVVFDQAATMQLSGEDDQTLEAVISPDRKSLQGVYKSAGEHRLSATRVELPKATKPRSAPAH